MLEIKSVTVGKLVCTCDRCGRVMEQGDSDCEWQERFIISFKAGYGSIFGDGNFVEGDFCQMCVKEVLGEWLRVTEDDPFDPKFKPLGEAYKAYQDYQFDRSILNPGRMVNLTHLRDHLDDLNQMRATLAERLGASENHVQTVALKYLLDATDQNTL